MATTLDGESKSEDASLPVEVIQRVVKKQRTTNTVAQDNVAKVKSQLDCIWNDAPENAPFVDNDGDPAWGPVVLCDRITWKDFDQWLDVFEGDVRRWIFEHVPGDDECGRVIIYSLPSDPHEATAGNIMQSIIEEIQTAGNSIGLIRSVQVKASPRCQIGSRRGKEPDMSISPVGLTIGGRIMDNGKGFPFPNVVIEVAYKNESLDLLRGGLDNWMLPETSVQVAIGIKLFVRTRRQRRYRAILRVRNSPSQEVEFGIDVCEGSISLAFPLKLIYEGVPMPPALAGLDSPAITIDLIALRDFLIDLPL
ncbi:uncharacterized protein PHALS_10749 [Plasmopara halstedii]|uniref:Restriction endonuclease domain-containing protein n=1 Tax=Plasmopara halstedii TaxID=4781 RepID=A0A0P1AHI9_PLAHL|nr:uncharacterized protein PHALS_10749 [Plasmopara halstedii]CEG40560.1 hypothetical protein PHALS_10749 [Plasmopara halstedii]|eukprot:XP_024576929.1 hypothetical protein PHALS_10749 [Plasmopara halstedii]